MWHGIGIIKPICLSEDNVRNIYLKIFFDPLMSSEPNKLHLAGFILKSSNQSFASFLTDSF